MGDISIELGDDHVAVVEIHRPPSNFFDADLICAISDAYEQLDEDPACRAIVLCSEGKHFCAGANFGAPAEPPAQTGVSAPRDLYAEAARIIEAKTPVVAAVHGAAIGGGLGLACSADFRVGCSETRMAANFAHLGFHHGFGLTITLPPIVGQQRALELLLTGKRIDGETASRIGLLDRFVAVGEVRAEARRLAAEIASAAPLAIASIRATMRAGIGERYRQATAHEGREQARLRATEDFREGIRASAERRPPVFQGK
ncbi:MAG: enoyl-CoA hydratase/isomerase family protein [Thermoflexaceae bacterium]|nr:enoyl-CoA hydratase/isomerase family protein [Thermoflexaceae bacterium]